MELNSVTAALVYGGHQKKKSLCRISHITLHYEFMCKPAYVSNKVTGFTGGPQRATKHQRNTKPTNSQSLSIKAELQYDSVFKGDVML